MAKSNKIKIGIKFSGNFQRDLQLGRTLPIESIVSLFDNKKYDLYSFQISEGLEKAEELGLINLKEHIHNWDDTFSALYKMNFVITSCSSVAHASSILGIKTFVLVPHNSYFVWEKCDENNHHSLWYGNNVICLKQLCKGDWSYPINQLQKYLNLKKIKKHIDLIYE